MLKLNVGFNKKVGDVNYGSRGANVNLELELESSVVNEPERLRDRVRQLFLLAKSSVDEELHGTFEKSGVASHDAGQANGSNGAQRDRVRRATAPQVKAIHAIAERQQIDVTALLCQRFGHAEAEELSITEASRLIAELKSQAGCNGNGLSR